MEDEARNVYREVQDRHVLRTADVYQTEIEDGVTGYSDTLLSVVANFRNGGAPEGFNAQSMVGKSKRGEVALRLFAVIDPDTRTFVRAGFKRGVLHARRMHVRRGAGHHDRRREDGARRGSRGQGVHAPFRHRGRPRPHRRLSRSPRGLPRRA